MPMWKSIVCGVDSRRGCAEAVRVANAVCGQTGFGMILWVKPADVEAAAKALGA